MLKITKEEEIKELLEDLVSHKASIDLAEKRIIDDQNWIDKMKLWIEDTEKELQELGHIVYIPDGVSVEDMTIKVEGELNLTEPH